MAPFSSLRDLAPFGQLGRVQGGEGSPDRVAALGEKLGAAPQLDHAAVEVPPLEALEEDGVARQLPARDRRGVDPAEVAAGEVAIAEPELQALAAGIRAAGREISGDRLRRVHFGEESCCRRRG